MLQMLRTWCIRSFEPTILFVILFFLNYFLLGFGNATIALFMTLSYMRLRNDVFLENNMLKTTAIYLGLGVASYLATIHLASCIFVNILVPFGIIYFLLDEFNPTNQIPYELAFIFYQMIPTDLKGLPFRLLSIVISCAITYLAIRLFTIKKKKFNIHFLAENGMKIAVEELRAITEGNWETVGRLKKELFDINQQMSGFIYNEDENIFFRRMDGQAYFPFIVIFQHMNNIVGTFQKHPQTLTPEDRAYLYPLCDLLEEVIDALRTGKIPSNLVTRLISFSNEHELKNEELDYNFVYILNYLATAVTDLSYQKSIGRTGHKSRTLARLKTHFNLHSFKMRFALRMTIVVCPCTVFAYYFQFPHAYWLPMTVFVLLLPFQENSIQKIGDRIFGTCIGLGISYVLYLAFPDPTVHMIILIVESFFLYATKRYAFTVIYITCTAISMNIAVSGALEHLFLYRFIYTFTAAALAILASFLIFPTRNDRELKNMLAKLVEVDHLILEELRDMATSNRTDRLDRDLILTSYLISGKIENHYQVAKKDESFSYVYQFLQNNNQLITNLCHIYALIAIQPKERINQKELRHLLDEFEYLMQATKAKLLKKSPSETIPHIEPRKIYDNEYINDKVEHSVQQLEEMYDSIKI